VPPQQVCDAATDCMRPVAILRELAELIESALPMQKMTSMPDSGRGKVQKNNTDVYYSMNGADVGMAQARKLSAAECDALCARLAKAKTQVSGIHSLYDDETNCTFDLHMQQFKASLRKCSDDQSKKSRCFRPVNTPIITKQSRDGLQSQRQHIRSVEDGKDGDSIWEGAPCRVHKHHACT